MILADTSVVVAAALPQHRHHEEAAQALPAQPAPLIAHVAVESYAVLTRLPGATRVPGLVAWEFLRRRFTFPPIQLDPEDHARFLATAADRGVRGGAIYDALIGATAVAAGATLVTLDQRALGTYGAMGVTFRYLP